MMKDKFRIRMCSDLQYEDMVVDICYEDCTVATITQEKGASQMEIEIFPPEEKLGTWKFALDDLINIIKIAKNSLIEMRKAS